LLLLEVVRLLLAATMRAAGGGGDGNTNFSRRIAVGAAHPSLKRKHFVHFASSKNMHLKR
jgi:hypothetical protein